VIKDEHWVAHHGAIHSLLPLQAAQTGQGRELAERLRYEANFMQFSERI
jgi:hypothetical protein